MAAGGASAATSAWLAGLVLGAAIGLSLVSLGMLGLPLLAAALVLIAWKGPRAIASSGLVTGAGLLWTVAFSRVALTCGATAFFPDPSCQTDDLTPWIAGAAGIFVVGLALSAFALRRALR